MNPVLDQVLATARQLAASDVHLKVGLPPVFRIQGDLRTVRDMPPISDEVLTTFAINLMSPEQRAHFERDSDVDLAYSDEAGGRYRINIFKQRGFVGVAMRLVSPEVPPFENLYLPREILKLADEERGLVLVTGATGSGKSTTLASMIDHINRKRAAHVVTIEDPIEYLHRDRRCVINQRELGHDTPSYARALRAALRQDPDVILVGEMRDLETMEVALLAAETGHLVLSTLHTVDSVETISRIVSVFPPHQQNLVRQQLAAVLKGVVSQRLLPRADGKGMVPAIELLITSERVRELISDPERVKEIHEAIAHGRNPYGMMSFDQSLVELVQKRLVTYEVALGYATRPDDFALTFRGFRSGNAIAPAGAPSTSPKQPSPPQTENKRDDAPLELDRFGK